MSFIVGTLFYHFVPWGIHQGWGVRIEDNLDRSATFIGHIHTSNYCHQFTQLLGLPRTIYYFLLMRITGIHIDFNTLNFIIKVLHICEFHSYTVCSHAAWDTNGPDSKEPTEEEAIRCSRTLCGSEAKGNNNVKDQIARVSMDHLLKDIAATLNVLLKVFFPHPPISCSLIPTVPVECKWFYTVPSNTF